jgi:type IV secretory pathway protease TraF
MAVEGGYTGVRVAVCKRTAYRAGDSVKVEAGRFVRYGTIAAVLERNPGNGRAVTYWARVRYGTGETELVSIGRLSPAPVKS